MPHEPEWARSNYQTYCVRLPESVDQRAVMERLLGQGIASRRGVMCAHREAAYPRGTWKCGARDCRCETGACKSLAESERAQDTCIMLPLFHDLSTADQDRVIAGLSAACETVVQG